MIIKELAEKSCNVFTASKAESGVKRYLKNGLPKGFSTGYKELDNYFTLVKGYLNIMSGVPGSGKSEMIECIALNASVLHNWRVWLYSPENYPLELHVIKFVTKIVGKPFNTITDQELTAAIEMMEERFEFADSGGDAYTLEQILFTIERTVRGGRKIDMAIIDPWNELEGSRPSRMTETDWIGESLKTIRRFARKHDINFWIVAHPAKLSRRKDGTYPEPSMYDLSGSQHWYNKSDGAIIMHRSDEDKKKSTLVKFMVKKIKSGFYGQVSDHHFNMDKVTRTYTYNDKMIQNELNLQNF